MYAIIILSGILTFLSWRNVEVNEYFVEQDNAFMLENEMEFFLMEYPTLKTTVEPA